MALAHWLKDQVDISREEVNLADEVANSRPAPLREFDQIYMRAGDLLLQTKLIAPLLSGTTVAFVGDGDCMSLMLGIFGSKGLADPPQRMIVLDFDERILGNADRFASRHGFSGSLDSRLYNIQEPLPNDLAGVADWFYTNPPYGSENRGRSCIQFIDRCIDVAKPEGSLGCVIMPYDHYRPWTIDGMQAVQSYLLAHGYVISNSLQQFHAYHLEDNPDLLSSVLLVDRTEFVSGDYHGRPIPLEELVTLYGSPRRIPRYVRASGQIDYEWP